MRGRRARERGEVKAVTGGRAQKDDAEVEGERGPGCEGGGGLSGGDGGAEEKCEGREGETKGKNDEARGAGLLGGVRAFSIRCVQRLAGRGHQEQG